ncbi:hypothetical protein C5167_033965 [Papaver somniferum]|uniref:Uncharacterized protein n=1 Tax=Papaver somniferum TaxID=3469 RepID=A0A4Y7K8D8_PAPSO|nr:hypothetical protein C5167_033965 [Papaver somniferum]
MTIKNNNLEVLEEQNQEHDDDKFSKNMNEDELMKKIQTWKKQITLRGLIASFVIGSLYSIVIMKLNLTTGITPNLNVYAALVAFMVILSWTKLLNKFGISSTPFTPQENAIIQNCSVACYSISLGGGFGSYLLGLNKKTYELAGVDTEGNTPGSYIEPGIGWMTGFLFATCFVGLLALVHLRKIMIVDYKLTYPSGTASGVIINGFHSPNEDKNAKKRIQGFTKFFSISFIWGFFQWFYSGGEECGFGEFPTFGMKAYKQTRLWFCGKFYFSFSSTYVGAGMICSHLVNLSLLFGAVISWGVMWPLIAGLKGNCCSTYLGDELYNFYKVVVITSISIHTRLKSKGIKTAGENETQDPGDLHRNEVFMRDSIPVKLACVGYIIFSVISTIVIPLMFPQLKWYYVVTAYIMAPSLGFCNAYGAGLTNINMAYNYDKVALFILAALAGKEHGVVAGLIGCGLIKSIVSISSDLMHDFKTGHLTLASPRSMLISQAVGTAMGCVVAPLSFFIYYKAFDIGNPDGVYKAPYALIYRNMVILGVQGFSALPKHCLHLCYGFFAFAVGSNLLRDYTPRGIGKFVPLPMAMAVPFLLDSVCMGEVDKNKAGVMIPAVASGLICGAGLWTLPSSILPLDKINPPICMKFVKGVFVQTE